MLTSIEPQSHEEQRTEVLRLRAELARSEDEIRAMQDLIGAWTRSRGFRLVQKLWAVRSLLAPRGGRREGMAVAMWKACRGAIRSLGSAARGPAASQQPGDFSERTAAPQATLPTDWEMPETHGFQPGEPLVAAGGEVIACGRPVFIVGSPRSGTSVLSWALHQHSQFWTSAESDFLFHLFGSGTVERSYLLSKLRPGMNWISEEKVGRAEYYAHLGLGVDCLCTSRSGGKRWVDSTPAHTLIMDVLAELLPGVRFLHILRDSRRVVHSMLHFPDMLDDELKSDLAMSSDWCPGTSDFPGMCRTWSHYVDTALTFAANSPERCLTILHEDLVATPETAFADILSFLDAPYEAGPAEFFRNKRVNSSFQNTPEAAPGPRTSRPWTQWPDDHKTVFLAEVGPTLVKHGLVAARDLPAYLA